MATAEMTSEQAIPSLEELEGQVREIPQRWLPRSEELYGWMTRWLEAWNGHHLDALTELVTDDIVWDDPAMFGETVHGRAEFRAFTATFFRALNNPPTAETVKSPRCHRACPVESHVCCY